MYIRIIYKNKKKVMSAPEYSFGRNVVCCYSIRMKYGRSGLDPHREALHILTVTQQSLSFQPVLHDWCNKDRGMCYPVCWMVHIKEPLLLIGKSSQCGGSGFPLSLSEWSFTIYPTPYNGK